MNRTISPDTQASTELFRGKLSGLPTIKKQAVVAPPVDWRDGTSIAIRKIETQKVPFL